MRLVLAVALPLIVAGCLCGVGVKRVGDLPETWRVGPELVSFSQGRYHQGGGFDHLTPDPENETVAPETCIAYRNKGQFRGDECKVQIGSGDFNQASFGPWTLSVDWENGCLDERGYRSAVVAFDPVGRPMAYWNGRMHPNASRTIE